MCPRLTPSHKTRTRRSQPRLLLCLCSALLISFTAVLAHAQDYTSIVVFGDSLSDTGNFADLTQAKYGVRIPGPEVDYTDGRFTDGDDTLPAAQNYFGVWIEQFAAMLPSKPLIKNSLDGGTNYAYGDAKNGNGTATINFGPSRYPSTSTILASRLPTISPPLPESTIRLCSPFGAAPTTFSTPPPRTMSSRRRSIS
jgi:outer membrane lipase/esterase